MADSGKMPLLEFTSQMRRASARVWVFHDRIEWNRRSGPSLLGRSVLAAATDGALEATGGPTGEDATQTMPIDSISSIGTQRIGMHVRLSFVTRDGTIEMDVSRSKAARVQELLRELMSSGPPAGL